jgi:hypothetical protein
MRQAIEEGATPASRSAFRLADHRFHVAVAQASGSERLVAAITEARGELFVPTDQFTFTDHYTQTRDEHTRILDAIAAHDGAAARQAAEHHLSGSLKDFLEMVLKIPGALGVVPGGAGDMGPPGGQGPPGDAGSGLLDLPVGCLLDAMVCPAPGGQVALFRRAGGPASGVVEVSVDRLGLAAGCVAGGTAGTDKVPEPAARRVLLFGLGVIAGASCYRGEGQAEAVQQLDELLWRGRLGFRGARWRLGFQVVKQAGMLAASAAVSDGRAVGTGHYLKPQPACL